MLYYLLPFLGAITGWASMVIGIKVIHKRLVQSTARAIQAQVTEQVGQLQAPAELIALVDQRMTIVIHRFKDQMPLAGLFLTEGLSQTIRKIALDEILNAWPELRELLSQKLMERVRAESLLSNAEWLRPLTLLGAFLGFSLGLFVAIAHLW